MFGDVGAVLIVDGDPYLAEALGLLLTKDGYHCTLATSAAEARARLSERHFAVALVDVMMHDGSGIDLVRNVLPAHGDLAVVVVGGAEDPGILELASWGGLYGYVVKPFVSSQVLVTVASASYRRRQEIERRIEREEVLKSHELALVVSEAIWQTAFESAPVAILELDLEGTITRANTAMEDLLEVSAGQLEGSKLSAYSHPAEGGLGEQRIRALARGRAKETVLRHLVTARGNDRWANGRGLLIGSKGGQPKHILDYLVDGTAEHLARQRVADAQARFSALVEHSADAIVVQDGVGGNVSYASPGLSGVLGIRPAQTIGSRLHDLVHPDDLAEANERLAGLAAGLGTVVTFDCRLRHSDGSWRHVEVTTTNLVDNPAVRGIVHNLHDVTDRVEAAARLAHQAMHDSLTGLPNRDLFLDRLDQALARAARSQRPCALLFIDLDQFKQINDALGHTFGDQVLIAVAERLHQAIRPGDSVARLGGDEFVVLAENIAEPRAALTIAERVQASIAQPKTIDGRAVTVKCSVGIALSDRHAPDALVQEADMALYRAKESGRNRWEIYDHAMRIRAHRRLEIEDLIRAALDDHSLIALHYQPIIELNTGGPIGTEALTRIQRPDGTLLWPGEFIPVAEDSGLIAPLGVAVLQLACAQQALWQTTTSTQSHVAVNVSARQLSGSGFVRSVSGALATSGLRPESVCIELTESTLIEVGSSTQARLHDLKAIGVVLALDDFGTGWSSLSYLRRFPIDIVKVDRSFVRGLGTNPDDTELVRAVVDLGRALDLITIAEGVETQTQDRLLREMGCAQGQGFLYGRPQPAQ